MKMKQLLHNIFCFKTFRDGKTSSVTYRQEIDDLVTRFPNLTLQQLDSIVQRPTLHREGNTYYEIAVDTNDFS